MKSFWFSKNAVKRNSKEKLYYVQLYTVFLIPQNQGYLGTSSTEKYLAMNFRHFLLRFNPFWQSSDFLDTIGPSRSLCSVTYVSAWSRLTISPLPWKLTKQHLQRKKNNQGHQVYSNKYLLSFHSSNYLNPKPSVKVLRKPFPKTFKFYAHLHTKRTGPGEQNKYYMKKITNKYCRLSMTSRICINKSHLSGNAD